MQLVKSSTLIGCQASLVHIYIYESINGCFECVGYHIGVCAAIRTIAVALFKKKTKGKSEAVAQSSTSSAVLFCFGHII